MQFILDDSDEISKMFVNKREFIKYCKSRLDVLMDKVPPIPKRIAKKHQTLPSETTLCIVTN